MSPRSSRFCQQWLWDNSRALHLYRRTLRCDRKVTCVHLRVLSDWNPAYRAESAYGRTSGRCHRTLGVYRWTRSRYLYAFAHFGRTLGTYRWALSRCRRAERWVGWTFGLHNRTLRRDRRTLGAYCRALSLHSGTLSVLRWTLGLYCRALSLY